MTAGEYCYNQQKHCIKINTHKVGHSYSIRLAESSWLLFHDSFVDWLLYAFCFFFLQVLELMVEIGSMCMLLLHTFCAL